MKDYEEDFVKKMIAYKRRGVDMNALAKEALAGQLGEGPAEILLMSLGDAANMNPKMFAIEMTRMFGRGAISIFEPIVDTMEQGLQRGELGPSALEAIAGGLTPTGAAYDGEDVRALHNFREEDEQGNYGDEG